MNLIDVNTTHILSPSSSSSDPLGFDSFTAAARHGRRHHPLNFSITSLKAYMAEIEEGMHPWGLMIEKG